MVVVAIIGILAAIGTVQYKDMVRKSRESTTKGNLGALRSALSVYYGDNESVFPMDDLQSLTGGSKYLLLLPLVNTLPHHAPTNAVAMELVPSDTGGWSYNNDFNTYGWGYIRVGCFHQDVRGTVWSVY